MRRPVLNEPYRLYFEGDSTQRLEVVSLGASGDIARKNFDEIVVLLRSRKWANPGEAKAAVQEMQQDGATNQPTIDRRQSPFINGKSRPAVTFCDGDGDRR